jgi:hypothetical protein
MEAKMEATMGATAFMAGPFEVISDARSGRRFAGGLLAAVIASLQKPRARKAARPSSRSANATRDFKIPDANQRVMTPSAPFTTQLLGFFLAL